MFALAGGQSVTANVVLTFGATGPRCGTAEVRVGVRVAGLAGALRESVGGRFGGAQWWKFRGGRELPVV